MDRRKFLQGALVAPVGGTLAGPALAQAWPTRNITMIVAFPPGGQADLAARPVAAALEKILGKSVVVDNRSGAGGMLGNAAAARAEPDGHTLLMALSSMTFLPEAERLYDRKPSYEMDQLVPIARVLADPGVLCARIDAPWKTLADLIADARQRPGQISFSSSGNYGAAHVPFEMFQQAAGIKLLHVPYRGGGPALTAFIGKQVDITSQAPGPITPHVQSGAARLLANWGPKRSAEYPDVPTFIELGYKDVEYYIWAGLFTPKGTPQPVIARLREAMREVMKKPEVTDVFVKAASPPAYMDQPEFQKFVDADAKRLIPVIRKIGRLDEPEMKVGLFDHIEHGERPTAQLFDERLAFIQECDKAGFYCLHLAEHHQTPLNMVPVPGVFLGAVARLTKKIKMGPLVYLLPLYSPLRMIDEICMLDHLSHGRAEIGVGRGVSPFELKYHKVEHDQSREIFIDAYRCIVKGMGTEQLSYKGPHYEYDNVPIAIRPLQQPHPPFWYGSSGAEGSTWAGEEGLHFVTLGPNNFAKDNIETFKKAFAKRGGKAAQPKPEFSGGVALGVQRHIFVDETDEKAHAWAKSAMTKHLEHINWIRARHGVTGTAARMRNTRGTNYEECVDEGTVIAGSPKTVLAGIERHAREIGFNYLLAYLFLGAMSADDAMRSLKLFVSEIMPTVERM